MVTSARPANDPYRTASNDVEEQVLPGMERWWRWTERNYYQFFLEPDCKHTVVLPRSKRQAQRNSCLASARAVPSRHTHA